MATRKKTNTDVQKETKEVKEVNTEITTINLADTDYLDATYSITLENGENVQNVVIRQTAPFDIVMAIAESIYNSLISNVDFMYILKRPLLVYHVLNTMSNVDVSDVVVETETQNEETGEIQKGTTFDFDKLFALSVSQYGQLIDKMLNRTDGIPYNTVYAIGQILDKKLKRFERLVANTSPSDDVLNEIYNVIVKVGDLVQSVQDQVNSVDLKEFSEKFSDFTPEKVIDTYLNKSQIDENVQEIIDSKNAQIKELKKGKVKH